MAVVVGAPDVDNLVKATHLKLVAVVGNVGSEIGIETVGAAEHIVLQLQLLNLLFGFAGLAEIFRHNLGGLQPEGTLLFIGIAQLGEFVHSVAHKARLMQGRLEEPGVILDAVAPQVRLHLGNVAV